MPKDIWIRADSTFAGSGDITPTQKASYLITQTLDILVHDDSTAGMMACRRHGFPTAPFSAGLSDFAIPCVNVLGKYKFSLLGVNDYDNGHTITQVLKQQKQWGEFVLKCNCVPWIISPLATLNENVDRPQLATWRTQMHNQCTARGYKYIDGTTLLDVSNRSLWTDGVHPNAAGFVVLVANLNAAVIANGGWEV